MKKGNARRSKPCHNKNKDKKNSPHVNNVNDYQAENIVIIMKTNSYIHPTILKRHMSNPII